MRRRFVTLAVMLLGQIASAQFGMSLFGGLPDCSQVGDACPIIGAQLCCGDQLTKCVDDGSGTGSGFVELTNCKKGQTCIPGSNGGACGANTESGT